METKNAGTLELRPVSQQALLDIIMDMGGVEALAADNITDTAKAFAASNRMLTYCLGWGVINDPPQEALDILEALGKSTKIAQIARANWLRYIALENDEAAAIIAEVMRLTFGGS